MSQTTTTELMLIKRAKRGDVSAFESLIDEHQVYCYNIALKMLKSPEDAKDVSQEALIKVFQRLKSFDGQSAFKTWLYRIVVNCCLDFIRKEKKLRDVQTDQSAYAHVPANESVERQVEARELSSIVRRSLMTLRAEQRLPIVLRDYLGLSYEDAAEVLNIPLGTLKSRLKRAREKLRLATLADPAFSLSLINGEEALNEL